MGCPKCNPMAKTCGFLAVNRPTPISPNRRPEGHSACLSLSEVASPPSWQSNRVKSVTLRVKITSQAVRLLSPCRSRDPLFSFCRLDRVASPRACLQNLSAEENRVFQEVNPLDGTHSPKLTWVLTSALGVRGWVPEALHVAKTLKEVAAFLGSSELPDFLSLSNKSPRKAI